MSAATVHCMLEAQGREEGEMRFGRDAETQLETDVIIVDEVSMIESLMCFLLGWACRTNSQWVARSSLLYHQRDSKHMNINVIV